MKLMEKGHFANNMNDISDINNVNVFIDHFEGHFANDFVNTKVNNTKSKKSKNRHSTK